MKKPIRIPSYDGPYPGAAITAIAETVARLLHPHAEVVLHDLATDRIAGIWNAYSARRIGDPSDIDDVDLSSESPMLGPYEKAGEKGQRLKSISTILRDEAAIARAVLCINLDISQFDAAARLLAGFAATPESRPDFLFRHDIREQVNLLIAEYLKARNVALPALDAAGRTDLIAHLDRKGTFQTRRAVDHVAAALQVSRTTVYVLLRSARTAKKGSRK
jgi:predicted transcriptional regulator YheO